MCYKKVVAALLKIHLMDLPTPFRSDVAVLSNEGSNSVVITCERTRIKTLVGAVLRDCRFENVKEKSASDSKSTGESTAN